MKSKLLIPVILLLLAVTNVNAQYKDLEGVFFGKVIAFGAGCLVRETLKPREG